MGKEEQDEESFVAFNPEIQEPLLVSSNSSIALL